MVINGLQKTTLLDFPGKVACTVFTGGCNLRCPFCHNASLVLNPSLFDVVPTEDFFSFLNKRKGVLDGVCITGGEPLVQKNIEEFMKKIKDMGFLLKLDSNGTFPQRLKNIIDSSLVDYVAMDVKNSKEKYSLTCGVNVDTDKISESIEILNSSNVPHEFRTTVVKNFHTCEDIENIAKWILGTKKYFLQCFKDSGDIIGSNLDSYTPDEMGKMLESAKKVLPFAQLRGV